MDGGADESPKRNRPKFQPLNIIKSPKRPNSGTYSLCHDLTISKKRFVTEHKFHGLQKRRGNHRQNCLPQFLIPEFNSNLISKNRIAAPIRF